jgi:ribosomal protein S16
MLYKLVLKRKGRYDKPFYSVVVTNKRNRIIEKIGVYNPFIISKKKQCDLNFYLLFIWLKKDLRLNLFLTKFFKLLFFS